MSHEPATPHKYAALSLEQTIGLFLAKLYGWLIRCQASGTPFAPADIAENVTKADALVHAFIRSRAAAQLEHAEYLEAARAMRDTPEMKRAGPAIYAAPDNATPAELISRLEIIISTFERAEAIGSALARMIVYTLALLTPQTREATVYAPLTSRPIKLHHRMGLDPSTLMSLGRGPPFCLASIAKGKGKLFVSLCTTLSADPRLDLGSRPENQQRARYIGSGMVTSFRWRRRPISQTTTVRPGRTQSLSRRRH